MTTSINPMMTSPDVIEAIKQDIANNPIILYMKGNAQFPQCGFSGAVVHILKTLEVDFKTVDILTDPEVRQGIKDYSQWPTLPQLYIKGEFIGGCDIVREMYESGELKDYLESQGFQVQSA